MSPSAVRVQSSCEALCSIKHWQDRVTSHWKFQLRSLGVSVELCVGNDYFERTGCTLIDDLTP